MALPLKGVRLFHTPETGDRSQSYRNLVIIDGDMGSLMDAAMLALR